MIKVFQKNVRLAARLNEGKLDVSDLKAIVSKKYDSDNIDGRQMKVINESLIALPTLVAVFGSIGLFLVGAHWIGIFAFAALSFFYLRKRVKNEAMAWLNAIIDQCEFEHKNRTAMYLYAVRFKQSVDLNMLS